MDHGAKIVNMSFEEYTETSPDEQAAVDYARKHDVLIVAASGNSHSAIPRTPAAVPGILAVGAMDIDLTVWKYSNYGRHIKLLAPGVHIRSAGVEDPYRLANGTSDSAAYVSAAAALLRSKFPNLTAGQIAKGDQGMSTGVIIGIVGGAVGLLVIILVVVALIAKKNRRKGPPPPGPGGYGGPGGPGGFMPQPPGPYQQPTAPGPYQQPTAPSPYHPLPTRSSRALPARTRRLHPHIHQAGNALP
ncbi:S8 family peptidase [Streptomyces chattanoogensis]